MLVQYKLKTIPGETLILVKGDQIPDGGLAPAHFEPGPLSIIDPPPADVSEPVQPVAPLVADQDNSMLEPHVTEIGQLTKTGGSGANRKRPLRVVMGGDGLFTVITTLASAATAARSTIT